MNTYRKFKLIKLGTKVEFFSEDGNNDSTGTAMLFLFFSHINGNRYKISIVVAKLYFLKQ
jgi:hypothetical protein